MKIITFLICAVFLFTFPSSAYASLFINEFSSGTSSDDWVEIYNSDSLSVDLSSYILRDSTSSNKIELMGEISARGFLVFEWSNKLNNSGDDIRLLSKSDESVIDQIIYGQEIGLLAPSGMQTIGRSPNGSASIVMLATSSKGESNNSSGTLPSPTITPTKSITPTRTPTPTKTPTSKPTPTVKASSVSPTKILTTNSSITKPIPSDVFVGKTALLTPPPGPTAILGVSESAAITPSEKGKDQEVKTLGQSDKKLPLILLILGVFMGACAILAFLIFRKMEKHENH